MLTNLMPHKADVYRPTIGQGTGQQITGYSKTYSSVPCFIQPADSQLQFFYAQRGTTVTHTIYVADTTKTFKREDVFLYNSNQYHLVAGPMKGLESEIYIVLHAEQYEEDAKVRLDMGEY